MTLTTPVINDNDSIFPGENFFFYWRTSASLWKDKLESFRGRGKVIVPLNWSFHTDTGDKYDFASHRPETDLGRLHRAARDLGIEIIFLVLTTPAPFLSNGGIPHLLARSLALNTDGLRYGILDADLNMNRIYSFYDFRIYQAFSKFVYYLGDYFLKEGLDVSIWSAECGYIRNKEFVSYQTDKSSVFEQGLEKFSSLNDKNGEEERNLKTERFVGMIKNIYLDSIQNSLRNHFEGHLKLSFIGGAQDDFFNRLNHFENIAKYSLDVKNSLIQGVIASSLLLPFAVKKGAFGKMFDDILTNSFIPLKLNKDIYEDEENMELRPLHFFSLFEDCPSEKSLWENLGLTCYIDTFFSKCYERNKIKHLADERSLDHQGKTYFIHGQDLEKVSFARVLHIFMNGGRVIFNDDGLDDVLKRRLETFILENSLAVEDVNFLTSMRNISLGDGRLIIFDGGQIIEMEKKIKDKFWSTLIETLNYEHLSFNEEEGLHYFWRTRVSNYSELNYEEIRRLSIYNPTSYKKKIKVHLKKNFVLLKVLDEININSVNTPTGPEVILLPEGSLSLEFGVFSDDAK